MATKIIPLYAHVLEYTQTEEDAYATTLSACGMTKGVIYIWNTTLDMARTWNGSAFENVPLIPSSSLPPGGGYDGDPAVIVQDATHRFTTDAEKTTWNAKVSDGDSRLSDARTPLAHNHDGSYASLSHNHAGVYEPANSNIQTHIAQAHAPSNAQKNSDITKAEIEAKLTGAISSHSHAYTFNGSLGSDVSTGANTTPVSLTGLVFSYEANSKYRIWFMGDISAPANTTGCGFQFDLSSAVTSIRLKFDHQLASGGTVTGGHSIADDASVGVSSGVPANGGIYPVSGEGVLVTGANAGTAQLRFRSEISAVITCKSGMIMIIEKIA